MFDEVAGLGILGLGLFSDVAVLLRRSRPFFNCTVRSERSDPDSLTDRHGKRFMELAEAIESAHSALFRDRFGKTFGLR
jgi:hypothetical protein